MSDSNAARYRFGPLERRGAVAGLGPGQVVSLALGLLVAVALLRLAPPPANLALAAGAVIAGAAAAFVPLAGRTLEEWVPALAHWWLVSRPGRRWRSVVHQAGGVITAPPPPMSGCEVLEHRSGASDGPLGVLFDSRRGTCTAVMTVSGRGFPLLDRQEKEQRLNSWAALLAGLAREGSVLHRIQWVERSRPGDPLGIGLSLSERLDPRAPAPAIESYRRLTLEAGPLTPRHETLVSVSISLARANRAIRAAGGGRAGAMEVLAREVAVLGAGLASAELEVTAVLGPNGLRRALATGFDPGRDHWRSPWPAAFETGWDSVRADSAWHATYWVAEWPRSEVGPDFLVPLLLLSSSVRAVGVTMEPVSPRRAAREVEAARTAGAADEELRRRSGFMPTARRRRTAEGMAQREAELADGHSEFRFSGYVTVTAADAEALSRSCAEVEQAAAQARLELRLLYGQQDEALTYTLPAGRGLR